MSLLSLPVPHSLPALILAMETMHAPRGPYVKSFAPTGEEFFVFKPSLQPNSDPPSVTDSYFTSPEAAIRAFWNEFIRYSASHPGAKLYWRTKPMVDVTRTMKDRDGFGKPISIDIYIAYSRFLLSNKPIRSKQYEEECLGIRRAA